jgi:microcystin-dependent protein
MATALRYPKGHQFRDASDYPVAAGKLLYERAGTSTPLDTYSDATGLNPSTTVSGYIVLDGAGRLSEAVYLDGSYDAKETLYTAGDSVVPPWPDDAIPRPQVLTPVELGAAPPLTAPININQSDSPYTVSSADAGSLIVATTAGGNVVVNLPPAASVEAGMGYWFLKPVAANKLTVTPNGAETIGGLASYKASLPRQSFAIVSDGASAWNVLFDSDGMPGDMRLSATDACPEGRLPCNGSAISRTTYAALYGVIGTKWGTGDGSTTFNLPDARGEFIRGLDGGRGVDAARAFGSSQDHQLQDHKHFTEANGSTSGGGSASYPISTTGLYYVNATPTLGLTSDPNSGANHGTETRPRNITALVTIKF